MPQRSIAALERTNAELREANATLEQQVRDRTAQLQVLVNDLAAVEERERRAIATDLHDDLVQLLNVIAMRIDLIAKAPAVATLPEQLEALRDLIHKCNESARSLTLQLSPPVLHHVGLVPALAWLSEEMRRLYGLNVLMLDDGAPKVLGQTERAMMFRAVRELLINVARHASVSQATLTALRRGDRLILTVSDEGIGFDPERLVAGERRSLGLASLYERLQFLGGTVEIQSSYGDGTVITLTLPLASAKATAAAI